MAVRSLQDSPLTQGGLPREAELLRYFSGAFSSHHDWEVFALSTERAKTRDDKQPALSVTVLQTTKYQAPLALLSQWTRR